MSVKDALQAIDLKSINTISNLLNEIYNAVVIPIAIFDDSGQLLFSYDEARNCMCFYRKFKQFSSYCSLLIPTFTASIIKKNVVDKLCDSGVRITTRFLTIKEKFVVITLFQFNLDNDNPELNVTNVDDEHQPVWIPKIISQDEREYIFSFIMDCLTNMKFESEFGVTL